MPEAVCWAGAIINYSGGLLVASAAPVIRPRPGGGACGGLLALMRRGLLSPRDGAAITNVEKSSSWEVTPTENCQRVLVRDVVKREGWTE